MYVRAVLGITSFAEPALHKTFGTIGAFVSRYPRLIVALTVAVLVALCGGLWAFDVEVRVNELLIARRGRIDREKKYFVDNFDLISPVINSVIVTAKPGVDIFSVDALDEVYALQEQIRTFTFDYKGRPVSLEQFCFKTVDGDPAEPCWQSSLLESFREGAVFNVGGENNTDYAALFQARPSYRDFNFSRDLTRSFIAQSNLNPDSLLLGGFEVDADKDTITHVAALQILFGSSSPEKLKQRGLQYYEWKERDVNEDACSNPSTCVQCATNLQPTAFIAAGCVIDGSVPQPQSCCDVATPVHQSPCVETIFELRPDVAPIANLIFTTCGLPAIEIQSRCQNLERIVGRNAATTAPEVCVCLAGPSDACTTAAAAFIAENQDYQETFLAAGEGDEAAIAEMGRLLVEEIGCPAPSEAAAADAEATDEPICSCLVDPTSETCANAALAFGEENPDQAGLFSAALEGDTESQTQLTDLLVSEFGCETPESTANPASTAAQPQEAAAADPPIQYEAIVTEVRDLTDTFDKARELVREWERAWREGIEDVVAQYQYINVVWITDSSIDDGVRETAEADFGLFVMGVAFVLVYIMVFVTLDWRLTGVRLSYNPPGPCISALCISIILLAVGATLGVAGYISSLTSFKISFTTVQMVPLLMLGLGVNDFFVLCSAFKTVLLSPDRPATLEGIMYEAMAIGGTSITLSSATNAVAFSLGTLSPVPIVLWFCVHMTVGIAIAYLISTFAIPSLLSIAIRRHLDGKPDFLLALFGVRLPEAPVSQAEAKEEREGVFARTIRRFRWPLTFSTFAVFAIWMTFGVYYMISFEQGLDMSESVPKNHYTYDYLTTSEDYFDTTQINVVFKDSVDYTDPHDFEAARKSEYEYVDEGYQTEKQLMAQSWMEFYTQYVETKFCSNEICMDEVHWYYDCFSSAEFGHPSKNICAGVTSAEECEQMCATHCPQAAAGMKERCQYKQNSVECYCPYRPMLTRRNFYENPEDFDSKIESYWVDFLNNTQTGRAARIFINLDKETTTERNTFGTPKGTRSYVYARGLMSIPRQLDHIEKGREILDRQSIDVYAFDYVVYAIGEQYDDLAVETVQAIGISMAVATVVMLPLIVHVFAAVLVAVCVLLSVLLTIGMTSWTVIDLDYSAYVAFIVTVGLSVEFCAHIARDFMLAEGDRLTRSIHALQTMGIAVFNGGVTTFLGILPSSLSEYPAVYNRLFIQYSISAAAGMFTGLFLLPTILSLIGPSSFSYEPNKGEKDPQKEGAGP